MRSGQNSVSARGRIPIKLLIASVTFALATAGAQTLPSELPVNCGHDMPLKSCRFAQASVQRALETLRPRLHEWRFVVVPDSAWPRTCTAFHLKPCVPAFSNLTMRATYLTAGLAVLIPAGRVDEDLNHLTPLTGEARLEHVLAHELGHILCGTANQDVAEDAGRRLRASPGTFACSSTR